MGNKNTRVDVPRIHTFSLTYINRVGFHKVYDRKLRGAPEDGKFILEDFNGQRSMKVVIRVVGTLPEMFHIENRRKTLTANVRTLNLDPTNPESTNYQLVIQN